MQQRVAEDLESELLQLRQRSALLDVTRLQSCSTLIDVARHLRRREADGDAIDPLLDARSVLEESIGRFQGESLRILAAAFAIGRDNSLPALGERQSNVAEELRISIKTVRRKEGRLIATLAHNIADQYQELLLRQAHGRLERQAPVESSLAIDWRNLFRHYFRIWMDLSGIRGDFIAFAIRKSEHPDDDGIDVYAPSSLHYFTSALVCMAQFEREEAGQWLFSSPDREVEISDITYRITWHVPANDLEQSWLRTELRRDPDLEKHTFVSRIKADKKGRAFLARWADWMRSCKCDPDSPNTGCELHEIIRLCDVYLETIADEWSLIADWYRLPPIIKGVSKATPRGLFKDFDYTLPDLEEYDLGEGEHT